MKLSLHVQIEVYVPMGTKGAGSLLQPVGPWCESRFKETRADVYSPSVILLGVRLCVVASCGADSLF